MKLQQKIELYLRAKDAYYNSAPIMADIEFDELEQDITRESPGHPALLLVGHKTRAVEQVRHMAPMLSMDKALTVDQLTDWVAKRAQETKCTDFVVTPKLDGMSCELRYLNGLLTQAVSRGDGEVGADITAKVRYVVPNTLRDDFSGRIRGELVLTYKSFESLNATLETPIANPRNGVVGLIMEEAILPDKLAFMSFQAYEIDESTFGAPQQYDQELELLQSWQFKVPTHEVVQHTDIQASTQRMCDARLLADETWDGAVYRLRDTGAATALGRTQKFWKRSIAWKFDPTHATVTVDHIEWSQGTRDISPIVVFHPVTLDGAIIQRAGGKSVRNMIEIGAYPGNTVRLVRSGAVIPWLQADPAATAEAQAFARDRVLNTVPARCPACRAQTHLTPDLAHLQCTSKNCNGALARQLEILAKALGIEMLGPANCTKLVEAGLVTTVADILTMRPEDLCLTLGDAIGAKVHQQVLAAVEKPHSPWKIVGSVGILRMGPDSAKKLIQGTGSVARALEGRPADLTAYLGIQNLDLLAATSQSITDKAGTVLALLDHLTAADAHSAASGPLVGKMVAVTGDLDGVSREEFKKFLEDNGARLVTAVSRNTSYLVTNDTATTTSKAVSARKHGVPVLTQTQFMALMAPQEGNQS